jgi:hypothetical protein
LTAAALATADIFDVEAIASDTAEAAFNFLEDSLPSENPLTDSSLPSNPLTDALKTPAEKKNRASSALWSICGPIRDRTEPGATRSRACSRMVYKKGKRKSKRNLRKCETCTYQRVVIKDHSIYTASKALGEGLNATIYNRVESKDRKVILEAMIASMLDFRVRS